MTQERLPRCSGWWIVSLFRIEQRYRTGWPHAGSALLKRASICCFERLSDFADVYNHGGAIDIKKVQSVKKAWLEVEKNEAWFKKSK
jgi:hypothetical protein